MSASDREVLERKAVNCVEHRFDLFGTNGLESVAFDFRERRRELIALGIDIAPNILEKYRPIEWHSDVRSGYRWDPDAYYLDVLTAPRLGTDIKFPREVSRFQHTSALALTGGPERGVEFLLQVLDWIVGNPLRRGVNWASTMDVAIRAINWVWGLSLFAAELRKYPRAVGLVIASLRQHGTHIWENLEYYEECTTNHYLTNVAGLLYLGAAFPEFPEGDQWLAFGLQELASEMEREVYGDGADYESSTSYHRLVAETFISCAALAERLPPERIQRLRQLRPSRAPNGPAVLPSLLGQTGALPAAPLMPASFYARLSLMARFTAVLTKPNGLVPQFGDNDSGRLHVLGIVQNDDSRDHRPQLAAAGILFKDSILSKLGAPYYAEAGLLAGEIAKDMPFSISPLSEVEHFAEAGIAVIRNANAYLAVICGPNGQNGRGGHGHNDKLSFELSVRGCDIVVDGGCPVYTADPAERNRFRSTLAHSTLWVEGAEQDPIPPGLPGLFRLPEHSHPTLAITPTGEIEGKHLGFGPPHNRRFMLESTALIIRDYFDSPSRARLAFNLDPAVTPIIVGVDGDRSVVELKCASGQTVVCYFEGISQIAITPGFFSTGYGEGVPNLRLVGRLERVNVQTTFTWK